MRRPACLRFAADVAVDGHLHEALLLACVGGNRLQPRRQIAGDLAGEDRRRAVPSECIPEFRQPCVVGGFPAAQGFDLPGPVGKLIQHFAEEVGSLIEAALVGIFKLSSPEANENRTAQVSATHRLIVDAIASRDKQQAALLSFAKQHAGRAGENVVRVTTAPISMSLSELELAGQLDVGEDVKLVTRKARPEDCICSNETAYYPPLAKVTNFAAGVTTVGEFNGRGLGTRWSTPDARSAYMATFAY